MPREIEARLRVSRIGALVYSSPIEYALAWAELARSYNVSCIVDGWVYARENAGALIKGDLV